MASTQFLSQAGSEVIATARKTALANSVLHLFKSGWTPAPGNVLADYLAHECDFDGYAPITLVTWNNPVLAPGSGWMTYGPQASFLWSHVASDVPNTVGGTFLVSAGGDLLDVVIFDTPVAMLGPGNSVIVTPFEAFPTGP